MNASSRGEGIYASDEISGKDVFLNISETVHPTRGLAEIIFVEN